MAAEPPACEGHGLVSYVVRRPTSNSGAEVPWWPRCVGRDREERPLQTASYWTRVMHFFLSSRVEALCLKVGPLVPRCDCAKCCMHTNSMLLLSAIFALSFVEAAMSASPLALDLMRTQLQWALVQPPE